MLEIVQLPVLSDNYVYVIHEPDHDITAVVDPALAPPVLALMRERSWTLSYILNTHHHSDHVGGNLELKRATGCQVVGMESDRGRIPGINVGVADGDKISIGASTATVMAIPGHTSGHIGFWFSDDSALFCGDTLFGLGCGRLFEGTPEQMWASLEKIRALPPSVRIYCAHEYTQANARFAQTVEPDNPDLQTRIAEISVKRRLSHPTVPSLLALELETNPFLRPESPAIRSRLGLPDAANVSVFAELRSRKDHFV